MIPDAREWIGAAVLAFFAAGMWIAYIAAALIAVMLWLIIRVNRKIRGF